jgi:serine/threonine protein kinase
VTLIEGPFDAKAPRIPLEPLLERDPRKLGSYRLLGRLGSGGMGVAFLAERPGGWAVVKLLKEDVAEDPRRRRWIARELEAMRLAAGPYTADLLEEHTDGHPAWFAMEFVPGLTLHRRVAESGPLDAVELESFAHQLKAALTHIHMNGLVHRDLKPSNVILTPLGPKLIDFGIAYVPGATQWTSGAVIGTLGWLSPEQIQGAEASPATDVYAWALCVIFAATGRPPFGQPSDPMEGYKPFLQAPAVPQQVPSPLRAEVERALSIDPGRRPNWQRDVLPEWTQVEDPTDADRSRENVGVAQEGVSRWNPRLRKSIVWIAAILVALAAVSGTAVLAIDVWMNSSSDESPIRDEVGGVAGNEGAEGGVKARFLPGQPPPTSREAGKSGEEPLSPPGRVRVSGRDRSVVVSWELLPGVTRYEIRVTSKSGLIRKVRVGDVTRRVIKGLVNDREYRIAIAGVVGGVVGKYSSAQTAMPRAKQAPVAPPQPAAGDPGGQSAGAGSNDGGAADGGGEADTIIIVPEPDTVDVEPVP